MSFQKVNDKKIFSFIILSVFIFPLFSFADVKRIDELNQQIEQKKDELNKLDKEIEEQKKLLSETSGQANTLQNKINLLENSRKKLVNDITATENKIKTAELTINKLDLEIIDKQESIRKNSIGISESIKQVNDLESQSLVERFLTSKNFSDFWYEFEQNVIIQNSFKNKIDQLLDLSRQLKEDQNQKTLEKDQLAQYKKELSGQAEVVKQTKAEQQTILQKTKNKESEYQKLLNEKIQRKKSFEQEILDIESKIKILIDPNSFPGAKKGIFSWPLDSIRVTQEFGGSQFAKINPGIYGRPFHPGTDFAASIGTKVMSIGSGTVKGVGNTDAYPGCYAWGKWILIEHENGISSLYAHLSSILVNPGDKVSTGQVIALSGSTGIATGPHLHLTLYASQGVKIGKYGDYKPGAAGCAATNATGPFADLNAYLDPMNYLPGL